MADPQPYVAKLIPSLIAVPAAQAGVCAVCRSSSEHERCQQCGDALRLLGWLPDVLPIALMTAESPLYEALRGYKNSSSDAVRRRHRLTGAALLATFARDHSHCLGEFDSVTAIPSVRRSAVEELIALVRDLRERDAPALVAATAWIGRTVDPSRYAVSRDVAGERILVVDDTFTSGATMFSACTTLREAGAEVVGPIAIGRFPAA